MTCGIYLLRFKGTDKVYVGQSLDIEDRFRIHRTKFKCANHSKKLLEAFKFFGYPEYYQILRSRPTSRFGKGKTLKERGIVYPNIISPEGISYLVENTSQFAKEHNINNGHLVQVLKGKEKQHKGWRLENNGSRLQS